MQAKKAQARDHGDAIASLRAACFIIVCEQ
jgi:hypothetical protein